MQDESDEDIQGMLDQIAVAMLSQMSSAPLRRASVDLVHILCQRCSLEPSQILGDRWKQPWLDILSLSLFVTPLVVVWFLLCMCNASLGSSVSEDCHEERVP
jgi:hypothetical protein